MAWDYEQKEYDKQAKADPVWYLERLINYGTQDKKIKRELLEKYLPQLHITDDRRAFLELLLWNKPF